MHIDAQKFGTVLISRPAGKEAFLVLSEALKEVGKNEKVEVDFGGVQVLTPAWADEFITPLKAKFGARLLLMNMENPSVKASLETLRKSRAQNI